MKETLFQTDACLNVFTVFFFFNGQLYIHDQFRKIYREMTATEEIYSLSAVSDGKDINSASPSHTCAPCRSTDKIKWVFQPVWKVGAGITEHCRELSYTSLPAHTSEGAICIPRLPVNI